MNLSNTRSFSQPLEWSLQSGYSLNSDDDSTYPLRALKWQLLVLQTRLNASDLSNICEERPDAYRIFFHLPSEIPSHKHAYTFADMGKFKFLRMSAEITKFDETLKDFPMD